MASRHWAGLAGPAPQPFQAQNSAVHIWEDGQTSTGSRAAVPSWTDTAGNSCPAPRSPAALLDRSRTPTGMGQHRLGSGLQCFPKVPPTNP